MFGKKALPAPDRGFLRLPTTPEALDSMLTRTNGNLPATKKPVNTLPAPAVHALRKVLAMYQTGSERDVGQRGPAC